MAVCEGVRAESIEELSLVTVVSWDTADWSVYVLEFVHGTLIGPGVSVMAYTFVDTCVYS